MEEPSYKSYQEIFKQPKSHKKYIILAIILIAVILTLFLFNNFIPSLNTPSEEITLSICQNMMFQWCNECLSTNNMRTGLWDIEGSNVGEDLAKCANEYFQTTWTSEQNCTGDSINYCLPHLNLPNE